MEQKLRRKSDKNITIRLWSMIGAFCVIGLFIGSGFIISHLLGEIKVLKESNQKYMDERTVDNKLNEKIQAILKTQYPPEEQGSMILWTLFTEIGELLQPTKTSAARIDEEVKKLGRDIKRIENILHKKIGIPMPATHHDGLVKKPKGRKR